MEVRTVQGKVEPPASRGNDVPKRPAFWMLGEVGFTPSIYEWNLYMHGAVRQSGQSRESQGASQGQQKRTQDQQARKDHSQRGD